MKITVRFFALYREIAGKSQIEMDVTPGTTVGALVKQLRSDLPGLPDASLIIAVNADFAGLDRVLQDGDEVALLPPMSGGEADNVTDMISITRDKIDAQAISDRVRKDAHGAVVTFAGVVRNNFGGKRVLYLEYDAYPEMALKKLREIAREIEEKWGLRDVAIVHRVGRLEIGEAAIVIAVGAAHRKEAFEACQYAIDRIKQVVPIWKKEFYQDGSTWVGAEGEKA